MHWVHGNPLLNEFTRHLLPLVALPCFRQSINPLSESTQSWLRCKLSNQTGFWQPLISKCWLMINYKYFRLLGPSLPMTLVWHNISLFSDYNFLLLLLLLAPFVQLPSHYVQAGQFVLVEVHWHGWNSNKLVCLGGVPIHSTCTINQLPLLYDSIRRRTEASCLDQGVGLQSSINTQVIL